LAFPVDDAAAARIFSFDDISLEVQPNRIAFKPKRGEDALLLRVQNMAVKVLSELSHTPLTAIGTNFSHIDSEPNLATTKIFDLNDNGRIAETGWLVHNTTVARGLKKNETNLNFHAILQPDGQVRFDMNYHTNTATTTEGIKELQNDILVRKNEAQHLIQQVYYPQ
jgi:hypothetical protein